MAVDDPQNNLDFIFREADLGFDEFIVPEWNFGRELDQRLAKLDRFHTEVASHFT